MIGCILWTWSELTTIGCHDSIAALLFHFWRKENPNDAWISKMCHIYTHSHAHCSPKWYDDILHLSSWCWLQKTSWPVTVLYLTGKSSSWDGRNLIVSVYLLLNTVLHFMSYNLLRLIVIPPLSFYAKKKKIILWALKQVMTLRTMMLSQQGHTQILCLLLSPPGLVITRPPIQLERPNTTLHRIIAILHFWLALDF